jgi:LacI family transcriptional regulator
MTIKEIAKMANVSIATVDKVLHKRGRVSKETIEKVKLIIKQTGYKPNIFASHLKRTKIFTFAVLMPETFQESKFWEATLKGIDKALKQLSLYDIKINYFYFNRYSEESFKSVSENLLKSDVDGILFAPVIFNLSKEFLKKIPENIPYVLFNSSIPDAKEIVFIGQDSYQSGIVAAKLMKMIIKESGQIAIIQGGSIGDYHHLDRVKGFKSFFENDKDVITNTYQLLEHPDKEWFFHLMDKVFIENENLRGVFVTNALTHYAAEYFESKNIKKKIFLIGYDLVENNILFLNNGLIDFLISQKIEEQGFHGIYSLFRNVILHESCEKKILMPIDIITKENLNYYK